MEIVTKAKRSCKAYEEPNTKKPEPEDDLQKNRTVHLMDMINTYSNELLQTEPSLGTEVVSVVAFCSDRRSENKKYPCEHQTETRTFISDPPI